MSWWDTFADGAKMVAEVLADSFGLNSQRYQNVIDAIERAASEVVLFS